MLPGKSFDVESGGIVVMYWPFVLKALEDLRLAGYSVNFSTFSLQLPTQILPSTYSFNAETVAYSKNSNNHNQGFQHLSITNEL